MRDTRSVEICQGAGDWQLHVHEARAMPAVCLDTAFAVSVRRYFAWAIVDNGRDVLAAAFDVERRWRELLGRRHRRCGTARRCSGAPVLGSEDLPEGQHCGAVVVDPLAADGTAG